MAKSPSIKVLLVQAGPTAWDMEGRVGGTCELPVCEAGLCAFRESLARLNGSPIGTVLCAPDEASRCSADMIAGIKGAKVRELEGLREMNLGLWEGMRREELEEKFPRAWRQWQEDPGALLVPEGETLGEAEDRIIGTLTRALARTGDEAKGVCVVLRPIALVLVRRWLDQQPTSRLWEWHEGREPLEWRTLLRAELRTGERARAHSE